MNRAGKLIELSKEGSVLDGADVNGPVMVTADRVKIINSRVRGSIIVKADGVKIKRTTVVARDRRGIRVTRTADGTRVLRSRIVCKAPEASGIVPGNYVAKRVRVNGCRKAFGFSEKSPAKVRLSWIDGKPYDNLGNTSLPTSSPTASPTATPTTTPTPPGYAPWPSPSNTGPRVTPTAVTESLSSSEAGQVISGVTVNGRLTVQHDNVTVRDVTINGNDTYMLHITNKADGSCPTGVLVEYTEINGTNAAENDIPIYMDCGAVFDHGYVHDVGRTSRLTDNGTVSNSYVVSNRTGGSGAHRGAVGTNGGSNNQIINNVLMCEGVGCSAAIPMYGDFAPVNGMLVQHNLLATTGGYCAYGGSVNSKPYPDGSNVRFIDNHFSTRFFPTCGKYGTVTSFDNGVRGNSWSGNVWHETGRSIGAP